MTRPSWESMTLAERERQYSPSSMIGGDLTEVIAAYVGGSEATRARFPPTTHAYGPHSDESEHLDGALTRQDSGAQTPIA